MEMNLVYLLVQEVTQVRKFLHEQNGKNLTFLWLEILQIHHLWIKKSELFKQLRT